MMGMPGFSFLATVVTALMAYGGKALTRLMLLSSLLVIVAGMWIAIANDLAWLTGLGVLAGSVVLGAAIGRMIPPRPGPMLLVLGILSVADIIWITAGGDASTEDLERVANLSVQIGGRSSSIGTVDLVLAATITTHWARRGASFWLALAAAPIGMVVSNVYVAVTGVDNLPLVPFITMGWLLTEAWHRRSMRQGRKRD